MGQARDQENYVLKLIGSSLSLGLLLLLIRAKILAFGEGGWSGRGEFRSIPAMAPLSLIAGYYDLLYVTFLTALFLVILFVARRSPSAQRRIYYAFVGAATLSLLAALANLKIIHILQRPLNYQDLAYSDFLTRQDVKGEILASLSVTRVLIGAAGLLATGWVSQTGLALLQRRFGSTRPGALGIAALLVCLMVGKARADRMEWDPPKLENPIISFGRSMATAHKVPSLLTMKTSVAPEDFEPPRPSSSFAAKNRASAERIRNVIIFVLESVAAQYLEPYGGKYPVTPELTRARSHFALFKNIYAHCPLSVNGAESLLLAVYPQLSYRSYWPVQAADRIPSISSELKQHGYRTAFLSSYDLRSGDSASFLAHHRFDRRQDYRTLRCAEPPLQDWQEPPKRVWGLPGAARGASNRRHLDANDECTVDALIEWCRESSEVPFFGVLWTAMTHHPYWAVGGTDFHVGQTDFNRYLNALHHSDWLLGKLLRTLRESHLEDSTLVVVVGDHGEAFGQHHNEGHAGTIYEEDVNIPLILINPELFHGETFEMVGGTIDVAPTVMGLLGFAPAPQWQGRSLFSVNRSGRAYFFSPATDHLLGLREGDLKIIYSATYDNFEVYNLSEDPHERVNRADQMPEAVNLAHQRLASWVQYQHKLISGLLASDAGQ